MARAKFSHSSMGNIIEVDLPVNPGLPGNRNNETLQDAFPDSPIYSPGGDGQIKTRFENLVMEGEIQNGYGFINGFNRDFFDAPDVEDVTKDEADNPVASPYAPNVASPDAAGDQTDIVVPNKGTGSPFPGDGLQNPKRTSENISRATRRTLGSYGLGESSPND
jgi:hypothetical protein